MGKRVLGWIMLIALIFNNTFSSFSYAFADDVESFVVSEETQSSEEGNEQVDLDSVDVESGEDEETDEELDDETDDVLYNGDDEEIGDEGTDDEEDNEDEVEDNEENGSDSEQNLGDNAELSGDIEELSGTVEELSGDVEELSGDIGELSGNNGGLTGNLGISTGDTETLSGNNEVFTGSIGDLTGDVEELTGDIEDLDGNIENLDNTDEFNEIRENLNEEIISGQDIYNDVIVSVEAPIGSFPEGTELRITPITATKDIQDIKDQLVENTDVTEESELVSFDISFIYTIDGEETELQPLEGKTVKIAFNYADNGNLSEADNDSSRELKVYHFEEQVDADGNKTEEVELKEIEINEVESSDGELVIDADRFSVYSVAAVKGTRAMCTVTFQNGHCYFNANNNNTDDGICTFDMPASIEVECGQTISRQDIDEPNHCTLAGDNNQTWNYYFAKWSTQISPGGNNTSYNYDFSTPVNSDITLYAIGSYSHYNGGNNNYSHTVTFNANGGTLTTTGSIIYGHNGLVKQPSDPIRTGYSVSCWTTTQNGSCSNAYNFNSTTNTITSNIILYAQWSPLTYTIRFDANGGSGSVSDITAGYGGSYVLPSTGFSRDGGYSLVGWNTEADGSGTGYRPGDEVENLTTTNGGVVTLYAQWGFINRVTFDGNGGTVSASYIDVISGQMLEFPTDPTYVRHIFIGWYLTGSDNAFNPSTPITEDIILYAHWEESDLPIVTFHANGGTLVDEPWQEVAYGERATKPQDPTKAGSGFMYWTTDIEGNNEYNFNTPVTGDLDLYAQWNNICTVSFGNGRCYRNNGNQSTCQFTLPTQIQVTCGTPLRRPEDPGSFQVTQGWNTYTYYFSRWSKVNNASYNNTSNDWDFDDPITTSMTLYAMGNSTTYTVTFNANGGVLSGGSSQDVDTMGRNAVVRQPDDPIRTGYDFKWWSRQNNSAQAYDFSEQVTANLTLVAQWIPITYTIKYNANGGTGTMSDTSMTYDTAKNLSSNIFTKDNATFSGWNTKASGLGTGYENNESVNNLTDVAGRTIYLYAQWNCNPNYHNENSECVSNTKDVACDASGIPENATSSGGTVQITWNGNGWSSPAPCSWSCNTGYTQSGNSCVPSSCTFNDQIIANGESVLAYQTSSVPFGQSCASQTRTCTNGTLSGSYAYANCTPEAPANCPFQGETIAHSGSLIVYSSASEMCPNTCTAGTVTCWNGTLGGDTGYTNLSCSSVATVCDASFTLTSTGANGTYSSCTPYTANGNSCSAGTTVYKLSSCNTGYHTEDGETCISNSSTAQCSTGSVPVNATPTIINVPITWNGSDWSDPADCAWTCNAHYHTGANNNSCDIDTFEITWVDGDGHTLTTTTVDYNVVPTYSGPTPTKTATAQYTYSFNGNWNPTPVAVTADAIYTAQFTNTVNQYKATIVVNNSGYGSVNITGVTADWGTSISTGSNNTIIIGGQTITPTPTANSAEFTYRFVDWTNTCGNALTENCTITANFSQTRNEYLITFEDRDGSVIDSGMVAYGNTPVPPTDPVRESTQEFSYSFSGWSPEIVPVVGTATYTAEYTQTVNQYTATISVSSSGYGTVTSGSVTKDYGASISVSENKVTIGGTEVTANHTLNTDEYTYTFLSWTNTCGSQLTGNCTITANFSRTKNTYQLTINILEGQIGFGTLSTGLIIAEYGERISINGNQLTIGDQTVIANATGADAQYTYSFSGWINNCGDVFTGNCTVVAEFTQTLNEYSVQFVNYNGAVLQSGMWAYGSTPSYTGATPTRPATAQYTYSFKGWNPSVSSVTGNIVYTAQFNSTVNQYTVTFYDEDGTTVLDTDTVDYGATATYGGVTPTKPATAQYTYTFSNWYTAVSGGSVDNLSNVIANRSVYAKYTSTINEYPVIFYDEDGETVLDSQTLAYGETPVYGGATPTKPATAQYTYTFAGWSPQISAVAGTATYVATYSGTVNNYTVIINSNNTNLGTVTTGSITVPYGTSINTGSNVLRIGSETSTARPNSPTAQYTYLFDSWTNTCGPTVTTGCTITANFSSTVNKYTVTWKNEDGAVLEVDENVPYGTMPTYDGETPQKTGNQQYSYTFDTWTPEVSNVMGNITYTATYIESVNKYTASISSNNTGYGTVNIISVTADYGSEISKSGNTISISGTKVTASVATSDAQYTYSFSGWINNCGDTLIGDCEIIAVFDRTVNQYNVTFVDEDGTTVLKSGVKYDYGTPAEDIEKPADPTKPATAQYTYSFAGWSPAITGVTEDVTYRATYSSVVNTYDIIFNSNGGTNVASQNVEYGSKVTKPSDPTRTGYTFDDWYTEAELSQVYDFDETIETGFTLYAKWNLVNYSISYELNGGSLTGGKTNPTNYTIESGAITLNNPEKTGYVFDGWTGSNGDSPEITVVIPSGSVGNREYTATWKIDENHNGIADELDDKYTVTYTDGVAGEEIFVDQIYTGLLSGLNTPLFSGELNRVGYTFAGWSPEISAVILGDATYTAEWIANTGTEYKVIHIYTGTADGIGSETVIETGYGVSDTTVTGEVMPRAGFVIPEATGIYITADGNARLTYVYERKEYRLRYNTNGGTEVADKMITYGALNDTGEVTTKTGYTFVRWSGEERMPVNGTTLEAIWDANTGIIYTIEHYLENISDTGYTLDNTETKYGVAGDQTQASGKSYSGFIMQPFVQETILGDGSTVVEIYYNREVYTITFEIDSGVVITYTGKYESPIVAPDDPTKTGYNFAGWQPAVPTNMPLDGITVVAKREQKSTQGGGSQLKKDYCPDGDFSDSYYDGTCGKNPNDNQNNQHGSAGDEEPIDDELLAAYKWAYANGITTIDSFEEADPDGYLLRGHMAKMVVNFMVNVLGFEIPDEIPEHCLSFNDDPAIWESEEIKDYAVKSCALGIMGIDMVNNEFLPNDIVSRAEFGTITSRILWGNKYNVKHTIQHPYYVKHLNALKAEEIMTKIDDPLLWKELRKWVRVVFKRVSDK